MLEAADLASYASGMAGVLRVIGPTQREDVLGLLGALHLTTSERQAVVDYALIHTILTADGNHLRATNPTAAHAKLAGLP